MADLHPCGTRGAYLRHHRNREDPCDLCLAAMRPIWAATDQKRRRRRPELEAPCGTESAYRRHLRREEPVDVACREAGSREVRDRWHERRRKARRGTIPAVIGDYVETYGPIELRELVLLIRLRHDIGEGSIRRAAIRMMSDGRLTRGVDIVSDNGRASSLPHYATDEYVDYPVQPEAGWVA